MDLAIRSLKCEVADFIIKPIAVNALDIALKRVRDRIVIRQKLAAYAASLEQLLRDKSELQDHLSSPGLMIGSISHGIKRLLAGLDGDIQKRTGSAHSAQDPVRLLEEMNGGVL